MKLMQTMELIFFSSFMIFVLCVCMCVPLCDGVEEDRQSILLHPLLKIYEIVDSLAIDILHHQHFSNMTIPTFYFYSVDL